MIPASPFLLLSWREDFLEGLLDVALEETGGDISRAVFLFPNTRPEKYLSRLLRLDSRVRRPLLMPRMFAVGALFSLLRGRALSRPLWNAGLLDRVGLLLSCVRAEEPEALDAGPLGRMSDAGRFFPWGMRLAELFEECFNQHRKPESFPYAEDLVSPFAAELLSRLEGIFHRYTRGLEEREWTTPGFDASLATDSLLARGSLPEGIREPENLYICGFHALNGTENILFRHLWQRGARVLIHGDPALASGAAGTKAHWSCERFTDWARDWGADLELMPSSQGKANAAANGPCIRYVQGFDLHSQLTALEDILGDGAPPLPLPENEAQDREADTVIVLPDSGLLMPVLHHLPLRDINISMGYPLSRSPLFRLLDTLARLQEGRKDSGYYWRDLIDLIRHPYLKMLRPRENAEEEGEADGDGDRAPLRRELHRLEQTLRGSGLKYAQPRDLLDEQDNLSPEDQPPQAVQALLQRLFAVCLDNFDNLETPGELGAALEEVCSLLLDCGGHLWERFLIDAECLFRIMQSLIPELSRSVLSHEPMPPETLYAMLRRLMQAERAPFEASPLVGLQVMGLLETRLLSFRRVIILDAGEDSLPGSAQGDPLLPEALRPILGLPSLAGREQVSAYNFFRLLEGAEDVSLLWSEGGDSTGIQEQKKKKSRFVEELLWREEKKQGRLLSDKGEDGPLRVLSARVTAIPRRPAGVPVSDALRRRIVQVLSKPVSATLLDSYVRCPLQFFYQRLAGLAQTEEVTEGDNPLALGTLLHGALQECWQPLIGQNLPGGQDLLDMLGEELLETVFDSSSDSISFKALTASLPADSAVMLHQAATQRLRDYLLYQPPTTPLALETKLSATMRCSVGEFTLNGKLDRIDRRKASGPQGGAASGIVILDYKTGRIPEVNGDLWTDESFWNRLHAWTPEDRPSDGPEPLLAELAERLPSVQLPLYLLLYRLAAGTMENEERGRSNVSPLRDHCDVPLYNAAWVELGKEGKEIFLFPNEFSQADRDSCVDTNFTILLDFLFRHLLQSPVIRPRPGEHCHWCSCAELCMSAVRSK